MRDILSCLFMRVYLVKENAIILTYQLLALSLMLLGTQKNFLLLARQGNHGGAAPTEFRII